MLKLSKKGQKLIELYAIMANEGLNRTDNLIDRNPYNRFQLAKFRELLLPDFKANKIKSVLDYGSGGSDWEKNGFDTTSGKSAKDYFSLDRISLYEPARDIDHRIKSDCVVCIDVLEHIFISDVLNVLRDIFSYAKKLVVLNVACYKANALLPTGENAHITIRPPVWWKGVLDIISTEFPEIKILLVCSSDIDSITAFEAWKATDWEKDKKFKIDIPKPKLLGKAMKRKVEENLKRIPLSLQTSSPGGMRPEAKAISDGFLAHMNSQKK